MPSTSKTSNKSSSAVESISRSASANKRSGQSRTPASNNASSTSPVGQNEKNTSSNPKDMISLSNEKSAQKTDSSRADSIIAGMSDDMSDINSGPGGNVEEAAESETTTDETPNLELTEGELLSRGRQSDPAKVTRVQEMLNNEGFEIAVDGKFGPETAEAVRAFQEKHGLEKIDGIVGPETTGAFNELEYTPSERVPATQTETLGQPGELGQLSLHDPSMSMPEQFEHYQKIVEANGGQLNPNGPTVVALRGLSTDGTRHAGNSNVAGYNESFVVLERGSDGQPKVTMIEGATHANARYSRDSHGVDKYGNTQRGVAMLAPGNYNVNFNTSNYKGSRGAAWHVVNGNGGTHVPVYRDTNRDGVISSSERLKAINDGFLGTSIMFHRGGSTMPSSIGCLTFSPAQHRAFTEAIGRNGFSLALIDANNARIPL